MAPACRRTRTRGNATPTMMTEPCHLRPPASAGRPAAGQGTIEAVMLITGSSASCGSPRARQPVLPGRSRCARHLPDLRHPLPRALLAPARTCKNPDPAAPALFTGQPPGSGAVFSAYAPPAPMNRAYSVPAMASSGAQATHAGSGGPGRPSSPGRAKHCGPAPPRHTSCASHRTAQS